MEGIERSPRGTIIFCLICELKFTKEEASMKRKKVFIVIVTLLLETALSYKYMRNLMRTIG